MQNLKNNLQKQQTCYLQIILFVQKIFMNKNM